MTFPIPFPDHILAAPIWVNWRLKGATGKSKHPLQVNGKYASVNRPATWTTLDLARSRYVAHPDDGGRVPAPEYLRTSLFRGIGVMHSTLTPLCTIDLDAKHPDPQIQQDHEVVCRAIYQRISGPAEVSISGKGVHIFGTLTDPELLKFIGGRKRLFNCIDLFATGGFVAMTGRWIRRDPMIDLNAHVGALIEQAVKLGAVSTPVTPCDDIPDTTEGGRRLDLTDEQVVEQLSAPVRAIYDNTATMDNWSENTFKMLAALDYISGDVEQIQRVYLRSPRLTHAGVNKDDKDRLETRTRLFTWELNKARKRNDAKLKHITELKRVL